MRCCDSSDISLISHQSAILIIQQYEAAEAMRPLPSRSLYFLTSSKHFWIPSCHVIARSPIRCTLLVYDFDHKTSRQLKLNK